MGHWRLLAGSALVIALIIAWPSSPRAQALIPDLSLAATQSPSDAEPAPAAPPPLVLDPSRWEFSLGAYIGRPGGYVKVSENVNKGNRLRLNGDLGVNFSESGDASAAFHLTPRDAIRGSFLYYFLRGQGLLDRSVSYNGQEFSAPGHVVTNADFYRVSLAYERTGIVPGGFLTGSVGLTYAHLDPKLTGHGGSNSEDFYRQALPVPIVGLRLDIPLGNGFGARASIGGGGLPRVNSGRKEGGTVYFEQINADATLAVTYAITKKLGLDIGPRATYFFQHEKSHQDDNTFELLDIGVRAGLTLRF